jgi:hypothetical protein
VARLNAPRLAVAQAADVFASEVAAARLLGFELQMRVADSAVAARLQPRSPNATAACERATGQIGKAIESSADVPRGVLVVDVMRDTIESALTMAREVMA